MRRVLFVSHAVEFAGAEIALVRFIRLLDRTRYEPVLLLPRVGELQAIIGDIPVLVVGYDITLHYAWDDPRLLSQIKALHAVMLEQRPDIIVVNTNTVPQAIIAALMTDTPLMVHLHAVLTVAQYDPLPDGARAADLLWLPYADYLVACSDWVARVYAPLLGRDIQTVPNTTPDVAAAPYPMDGPRLIVMLASLEDNKRPAFFIAAAAKLRRAYPQVDFRCRLYGDGPTAYIAALQAEIQRHGLTDVFTIHTRTADTAPIYAASAVVFVPSAVEAFSLVTIEAASHARPVVATRSGGPDSIVIDGETGALIPVDDLDAAVDRLGMLLTNPPLAAEMGRQARARYEAHFAPSTAAAHYHAALDATVRSAQTAPERRRCATPLARYFMECANAAAS